MDKNSLLYIEKAAPYLATAEHALLSGAILTAKYVLDALMRTSEDRPSRAADISRFVKSWAGREVSPSNVRQILGALRKGGAPICSATSAGYWLEELGE